MSCSTILLPEANSALIFLAHIYPHHWVFSHMPWPKVLYEHSATSHCQPPLSPFFFTNQRGETNQGRNGFASSQKWFVWRYGWVRTGGGKWVKVSSGSTHVTREWILDMAITDLRFAIFCEWAARSRAMTAASRLCVKPTILLPTSVIEIKQNFCTAFQSVIVQWGSVQDNVWLKTVVILGDEHTLQILGH